MPSLKSKPGAMMDSVLTCLVYVSVLPIVTPPLRLPVAATLCQLRGERDKGLVRQRASGNWVIRVWCECESRNPAVRARPS